MISKVHIETAVRADKTNLKNCFCTPPFKVLDITEDKHAATLHLMLMNASPGVLDGDCYQMQIDVGSGSTVQLHTQSYQRLFRMKGQASQQIIINMEEGSSLCYIPHPTVPHEASNFMARNTINITSNCALLWGEVFTCGRKESGEQFTFSKYHSITQIFLNNKLVVKENVFLQPSLSNLTALGQLEGYTHQASLLYLHEHAPIQLLMNTLYDLLSNQPDICVGISALPIHGFMVRLLGYKGEQLCGLLKKLGDAIIKSTTGTPTAIIKEESYAT